MEPVRRAALVLALLTAASAWPTGAPVPGALVEEFDTLDGARWLVREGPGPGSCVGTPCFSSSHVAVADGQLVLGLDAQTNTGAQLRTQQAFGLGLYEFRLRAPAGPGAIFALFPYGCPPGDEIDLVEFINASHDLLITSWVGNSCTGLGGHADQWTVPLPFDPSLDFHTYRFAQLPDRLVVSADGEVLKVLDGRLPSSSLPLYVNLWRPGWIGAPVAGDLEARVD